MVVGLVKTITDHESLSETEDHVRRTTTGIPVQTGSFKAWMGEAETAIKSTVSNATDQLKEIGVAITEVRRLWAEIKHEI